jgi:hypothetical protein
MPDCSGPITAAATAQIWPASGAKKASWMALLSPSIAGLTARNSRAAPCAAGESPFSDSSNFFGSLPKAAEKASPMPSKATLSVTSAA